MQQYKEYFSHDSERVEQGLREHAENVRKVREEMTNGYTDDEKEIRHNFIERQPKPYKKVNLTKNQAKKQHQNMRKGRR